jgi:hypothetical protein
MITPRRDMDPTILSDRVGRYKRPDQSGFQLDQTSTPHATSGQEQIGRVAVMTTMSQRTEGATIRFDATLFTIDTSTMLRLPETASKNLPSRGQVAVHGTVNGVEFQTVLEPDGSFGHWMRVDDTLQHAAGISAGDAATLDIEVTKDWPEPSVPQDLATALAAAPQKIQDLWNEITPMARWEWVRWVNATNNPDTRRRRVDVSISKMKSGKRRPCCFNLSACTDPDLSKNGRLLEPGDDRP